MTVSLALAWLAAERHGDERRSSRHAFFSRPLDVELPEMGVGVPADERACAARVRAGDEHAFDDMYLTYFAQLAGFAASYVHDADAAEDVVQEVFRRIWKDRAAFAPRGAIRAYLYGAVRNGALNVRRHDRVTHRRDLAPDSSPGAGEPPIAPDMALQLHDAIERVARLLATMPDERRHLVSLRWQHHLSYTEIAAVVGLSEQAARAQVSRVARQLRAVLDDVM